MRKPKPPLDPTVGDEEMFTLPIIPAIGTSTQSQSSLSSTLQSYEQFKAAYEAKIAKFNLADMVYHNEITEYKMELDAINEFGDWLEASVSTHLYATCCTADRSLREQLEEIKAAVGVSDKEIKLCASRRYR